MGRPEKQSRGTTQLARFFKKAGRSARGRAAAKKPRALPACPDNGGNPGKGWLAAAVGGPPGLCPRALPRTPHLSCSGATAYPALRRACTLPGSLGMGFADTPSPSMHVRLLLPPPPYAPVLACYYTAFGRACQGPGLRGPPPALLPALPGPGQQQRGLAGKVIRKALGHLQHHHIGEGGQGVQLGQQLFGRKGAAVQGKAALKLRR